MINIELLVTCAQSLLLYERLSFERNCGVKFFCCMSRVKKKWGLGDYRFYGAQ